MATERKHPTDAHITRLYTLAAQAGLDHAGVKDELFARYGVDSTRDLSLRQYEQFTAFLEGMTWARCRAGSPNPAIKGPGKLNSRADCAALLRREWPELFPRDEALAADLVEALDCWRLTRLSGTLGEGIASATIQQVGKADLRDVRRATAAYLTGYTTRNERYFLGMVRGAKRDRLIIERRQQRQAKNDQRKRSEAEGIAQDVIARAGERPPVPQALACPAGSAGVSPAVCPYCEGKSRLWYQAAEDAPFVFVPCPWCVTGRRELLAQVQAGKRFDHVNWPLVREQIEERLARRALEKGEAHESEHVRPPGVNR